MAAAGHPHPPLRLARQPQKGNGYTREGFNGKPRRPATQTARSSPPPRKPRPPAEGRRHTQQPTPPPHKPPHTPRDRPPSHSTTPGKHQPTTTPNNTHTTPPTQTPAHTPGPGQCQRSETGMTASGNSRETQAPLTSYHAPRSPSGCDTVEAGAGSLPRSRRERQIQPQCPPALQAAGLGFLPQPRGTRPCLPPGQRGEPLQRRRSSHGSRCSSTPSRTHVVAGIAGQPVRPPAAHP